MVPQAAETSLLSEEDAWRIALAWSKPLWRRARLVSSRHQYNIRTVQSYEWVTLLINNTSTLDKLLDQVHLFKAACTVWFALSCCRGYSGRENPSFWKRVFGALRGYHYTLPSHELPYDEEDFQHHVTDSVRFFAEDGLEFPRVQLFANAADYGVPGDKLVALLQFFFHGTENPTDTMQRTESEMNALLDELAPYVVPSRASRSIPVSLNSLIVDVEFLSTLPFASQTMPTLPSSVRQPAFLIQSFASVWDSGPGIPRMTSLFLACSIEITYMPLIQSSSEKNRDIAARNAQLVLGIDPSVHARVKSASQHIHENPSTSLVAMCSALPQSRWLEMLTLRSRKNALGVHNTSWIGYALFHPDGQTSSWTDLDLNKFELTMEHIEIFEAMAMGNNLLALQTGQIPQNTAYHSADLRNGSVIRLEPVSNAATLLTMAEDTAADILLPSGASIGALPNWIGVIVPTYGLGWTLASNVIGSVRARPPAGSNIRSLVVDSTLPLDVLLRYLTLFGQHLRFLDIASVQILDSDAVERVVKCCPSLESLCVCHDGAYWSEQFSGRLSTPQLKELELCLPRDPDLDVSRHPSSIFTTDQPSTRYQRWDDPCTRSTYVTPSHSAANTSLRHLRALRLVARVNAEFGQSRGAVKQALCRLPSLGYFHFATRRTSHRPPLSYENGRKFTWECMNGSDGEEVWTRNQCLRRRLLSFISVARHPGACGLAVQRLDQHVMVLIVRFASYHPPLDLWITNEGNEEEYMRS